MDYNVTESFLGVPVPGDEPSTLDHPCHYLSLPNQTEEVMRFKAVSLSPYWLWIWIRESLRLRGQHARAICFPLAII